MVKIDQNISAAAAFDAAVNEITIHVLSFPSWQ